MPVVIMVETVSHLHDFLNKPMLFKKINFLLAKDREQLVYTHHADVPVDEVYGRRIR